VRPRERLELSVAVASEDATSAGVGLGAGRTLLDRDSKVRGRSERLGARYRTEDDGELRLELSEAERVYGFAEDHRESERLDRRLDSREDSRELSLVGSQSYLSAHETVLGVEGGMQQFESNQMASGSKQRDRSSAFTQHEWRPMSGLALVPGVRYDHDSQFGEQLSKAFTLRVDPVETVQARISYGEGYRAPSFSELYLDFDNQAVNYRVRGNEDLRPETSRSVQASLSWQANADLWLSVGVFGNRVKDLIATQRRQPDGVLLIDYANVDSVRNQGVEASGRVRSAKGLTLGFDYTFLEARDETRRRQLEGRAMHFGSVQARHEAQSLGLTTAFVMSLVGRRPIYVDMPSGQTTEWAKAYRAATLRIEKRVGENLQVFTGVRNLTDEAQERLHPALPRSYFAGTGASW
jgi:outer membrane receptor for ferrienterochelin and colicins